MLCWVKILGALTQVLAGMWGSSSLKYGRVVSGLRFKIDPQFSIVVVKIGEAMIYPFCNVGKTSYVWCFINPLTVTIVICVSSTIVIHSYWTYKRTNHSDIGVVCTHLFCETPHIGSAAASGWDPGTLSLQAFGHEAWPSLTQRDPTASPASVKSWELFFIFRILKLVGFSAKVIDSFIWF